MKNFKFYCKLITFSSVCLISPMVSAQDDLEIRKKAMKDSDERLQGVYERNLPNKKEASVVRNYPEEFRVIRENAQKKENEIAQKQAEYQRISEEYAAMLVEDKISHEKRVETINKQQQPFLNYLGSALPHINVFDKADWYTDRLFVLIEGPKVRKLNYREVKELNYSAATTALTTFDAVKTNATYEDLMALLDEGKLLFHSTRTRINYIYERFPEQTKATELFELNFLPYYYGANRSFVIPAEKINNFIDAPMYYPPTYFDTGSDKENIEITGRFVALTNKYPNEGLSAAKKARYHINPFVIFAQSLNSDKVAPEKITKLKNENYWRAIYCFNTEENLVEAFSWLNCQKDMYAKLKSLTPEDWLAMGSGIYTLKHLEAKFLIKGLLGGGEMKYWDDLSKKYKSINNAVTIMDKEIAKERKAKEKIERQNK